MSTLLRSPAAAGEEAYVVGRPALWLAGRRLRAIRLRGPDPTARLDAVSGRGAGAPPGQLLHRRNRRATSAGRRILVSADQRCCCGWPVRGRHRDWAQDEPPPKSRARRPVGGCAQRPTTVAVTAPVPLDGTLHEGNAQSRPELHPTRSRRT